MIDKGAYQVDPSSPSNGLASSDVTGSLLEEAYWCVLLDVGESDENPGSPVIGIKVWTEAYS